MAPCGRLVVRGGKGRADAPQRFAGRRELRLVPDPAGRAGETGAVAPFLARDPERFPRLESHIREELFSWYLDRAGERAPRPGRLLPGQDGAARRLHREQRARRPLRTLPPLPPFRGARLSRVGRGVWRPSRRRRPHPLQRPERVRDRRASRARRGSCPLRSGPDSRRPDRDVDRHRPHVGGEACCCLPQSPAGGATATRRARPAIVFFG